MTSRREQLLAEQERIKLELEKLDNVKSAIIPLEDYTDEQKIDFFDALYKMSEDVVKEMENTGFSNDDEQNWFYEMGMSVLNLKDTAAMWKYINTLA
jgi:hypothetical protein